MPKRGKRENPWGGVSWGRQVVSVALYEGELLELESLCRAESNYRASGPVSRSAMIRALIHRAAAALRGQAGPIGGNTTSPAAREGQS